MLASPTRSFSFPCGPLTGSSPSRSLLLSFVLLCLALASLPGANAYYTMSGQQLQCGKFKRPNAPVASISGRELRVHNERFFVKGMCYEPKPLGLCRRSEMSCLFRDDGHNSSDDYGFCYGNNYSNLWLSNKKGGNCWDTDLITAENERRWKTDVDIMHRMGVNTIRLYTANPMTCTASRNARGRPFSKDTRGLRDHIPFMNYVASKGMYVIYPLYLPDSGTIVKGKELASLNRETGLPEENFKLVQLQLDELDNHPALLMWSVGNELLHSIDTKPGQKLLKYVNDVADYVKSKSKVPTTHALVDDPETYNSIAAKLSVDVLSVNVYRGNDLTDLWDELEDAEISKPVVIAELGAQPVQCMEEQVNPDWPLSQWKDILNHSEIASGACYFAFSDVGDKEDGKYGMFRYVPASGKDHSVDDVMPNAHDAPDNSPEQGSSTGFPLNRDIVHYYQMIYNMSNDELVRWGKRYMPRNKNELAKRREKDAKDDDEEEEDEDTKDKDEDEEEPKMAIMSSSSTLRLRRPTPVSSSASTAASRTSPSSASVSTSRASPSTSVSASRRSPASAALTSRTSPASSTLPSRGSPASSASSSRRSVSSSADDESDEAGVSSADDNGGDDYSGSEVDWDDDSNWWTSPTGQVSPRIPLPPSAGRVKPIKGVIKSRPKMSLEESLTLDLETDAKGSSSSRSPGRRSRFHPSPSRRAGSRRGQGEEEDVLPDDDDTSSSDVDDSSTDSSNTRTRRGSQDKDKGKDQRKPGQGQGRSDTSKPQPQESSAHARYGAMDYRYQPVLALVLVLMVALLG